MRRHTSQHGFTLVELLVASAVMGIILGALGSLFATTNRAYRANDPTKPPPVNKTPTLRVNC